MKRIMAMLLALLLLFGGAAMADDDLNAIVQQLEGYLDDLMNSEGNRVSTTKLEKCVELLKKTKNRNKKPLELYCSVLLSIERNQFDSANDDMFVLRNESMTKAFEENFVRYSIGGTSISTVEQLYNYLQGRKAEYEKKYEEALAFYGECLVVFDSYYRTENIKHELYEVAMEFYAEGKYEWSKNILERLAQMMYEEAVQALRNFVTPTPAPVPLAPLVVGDYVEFGSYPQTADGNDNTPIKWLVLENDGETALLISRYALDGWSYNTSYEVTTWEYCTLRSWLNNEFYSRAFGTEEKNRIVKSNISADKNPSYSTDPGNATEDNVFILSVTEAKKYFSSNEARRCAATDYVIQRGEYKSGRYDGKETYRWWLRSPGLDSANAAIVYTDGSFYNANVSSRITLVRPCVRVRLF